MALHGGRCPRPPQGPTPHKPNSLFLGFPSPSTGPSLPPIPEHEAPRAPSRVFHGMRRQIGQSRKHSERTQTRAFGCPGLATLAAPKPPTALFVGGPPPSQSTEEGGRVSPAYGLLYGHRDGPAAQETSGTWESLGTSRGPRQSEEEQTPRDAGWLPGQSLSSPPQEEEPPTAPYLPSPLCAQELSIAGPGPDTRALGPRLPPIVQSGKLKSTSRWPRPSADISAHWPGRPPSPGHPEPSSSRAATVPASPTSAQGGPGGRPGRSPPQPPPGRAAEAGSRHQRPPDAPALGRRSAPSLAAPQALGRRPLTQPPRDAGALGRSACGSPGPRGRPLRAARPLRPARARRGPGAPGAPAAPPPPLAPSPRRLPRAPAGSARGRPAGVRAAPADGAEPPLRPPFPPPAGRGPQPSNPLSERREETLRPRACRRGPAPRAPGPRTLAARLRPQTRGPTDLLLERRRPRPRRRWGSGSARGRPPPAASSPARPAPRPAARPPRRAEPGVPRARCAPSALPAPASAQATRPVPSDDSLGPGRRPALAPLLREAPGAPAPVSPHREAQEGGRGNQDGTLRPQGRGTALSPLAPPRNPGPWSSPAGSVSLCPALTVDGGGTRTLVLFPAGFGGPLASPAE
ncbi:basic proline-rich protein-like [Moschus berezovskii]|uniref:basic proline-rich protein-like n=1 Tax=Moschus berezovskii TaxID=68408 RepID=UPI00244510D6|nr:basic proline-rich protein-like [Moschus berezovskii]